MGICLALAFTAACRPPSGVMRVAYISGDIYLPQIESTPWREGDVLPCQLATRTSIAPDKRGDLLLCGEKTRLAWDVTWLREDIRTSIYQASHHEMVKFLSRGSRDYKGGRGGWLCRKTADGIECK
jgi:hypothetical protein